MPPRIRMPCCLPSSFVVRRGVTPILPFLAPTINACPTASSPTLLTRSASILSTLSDNRSAYNKRIRRGRGPSSGKGKTSGRGHKGQRQHGGVPAGFEGGQTPLHIVKGKRGFTNVHTPEINTVPISRILSWIAQGRIDPTKPITVRELALSKCVNNIKDGVKLLSSSRSHDLSIDEVPTLSQPLHIVVSRASRQVIEEIEKAGGTVMTRFYSRFAIKKIAEGKMDPIYSLQAEKPDGTTPRDKQMESIQQDAPVDGMTNWKAPALTALQYRLPDATSRRDTQYYRDPAHRGYLSYQLKKGENPSLFFKSPEEYKKYARKNKAEKKNRKAKETDKLW